MADRVHPGDDASKQSLTTDQKREEEANPIPSFVPRPKPPPGTYVVQIPKDQIYRVPPSQTDRRQPRCRPRRGSCRRCCCCAFFFILLLLLAAALLSAAFYFAARPRALRYSLVSVSARGFNLTSARPISPELLVGVRSDNPNKAVSVYYRPGSAVTASYAGVELVNGALPAFYQGTENVTALKIELKGPGLKLADDVRSRMTTGLRRGNIPLDLDVTAPVQVRVWGVRSWTVQVRVKCVVALNKLAGDTNVISSKCRARLDPFP